VSSSVSSCIPGIIIFNAAAGLKKKESALDYFCLKPFALLRSLMFSFELMKPGDDRIPICIRPMFCMPCSPFSLKFK